jgi:hypothetical protein
MGLVGSGAVPQIQRKELGDAVAYVETKHHAAADKTWGQAGLVDFAIEMVLDVSPNVRLVAATRNAGDSLGFLFYTITGKITFLLGTPLGVTQIALIDMQPGQNHIFVGVDVSDRAIAFVNGLLVKFSLVNAIAGDYAGAQPLNIGGYQDGTAIYDRPISSFALWNLTDNPWPGAATNAAVMGAVAAARFAALVGGADSVRARALAGSPSAIGRVARTYSLPGLVADCDCTVSEPAPGGGGLWSHPTDQPRLAPDGLRATIARTNLLAASVPTWTATNATVTANTLDAWGVSDGQRVRETTADGKHNVVITKAGCTPGQQHSLSVVLRHTAGRAVRVLGGFSDDIAFYNGGSWVPFVDPGES